MSEPFTKIKQTIDTSIADREFIEIFYDQVSMLCGMVHEGVDKHPEYLFSKELRRSLIDKAREVAMNLSKINYKLCLDNPLDNLEWERPSVR